MFVICIINTAIITISTLLKLQCQYLPLCHFLQENLNIIRQPPHFILPYPHPFLEKNFRPPPPYQSILEKLQKVAQTLASDKPLVSTLSTT